MNKITVRLGPFQAPLRTVWGIICWLPKQLAGTPAISHEVSELRTHTSAMTEILHIVVADLSGNWTAEQRERVQREIANFRLVNTGLGSIKPRENPFTPEELRRLQAYTQRAEHGEFFQPQEAHDFRQLSERAAHEYAGQDWVTELLKVAFFIFALYAVHELLKR